MLWKTYNTTNCCYTFFSVPVVKCFCVCCDTCKCQRTWHFTCFFTKFLIIVEIYCVNIMTVQVYNRRRTNGVIWCFASQSIRAIMCHNIQFALTFDYVYKHKSNAYSLRVPDKFVFYILSSTVSSTLNSASAVTWQDVLKYFFSHLPEARKTFITKILGKTRYHDDDDDVLWMFLLTIYVCVLCLS